MAQRGRWPCPPGRKRSRRHVFLEIVHAPRLLTTINLVHVVDQVPARLGRAGGQDILRGYVFKLGKIFVKETCQFFCLNIVFMGISPGIAGP